MRTLLVILLAISISGSSFAQNSEVRKLDNFSEVSVGEAVNVILVKGNKNEANITSSNIDLDEIETDVSGDRLRIGIEGRHRGSIKVSITLTYKEIDELNISSAADVNTKGAIETESLAINVSSAGDGDLEIDVKELKVEVSSAGDLYLKGKAVSQRVNISSAGDYDGYDLVCETVNLKVSSAGSAEVYAKKEIDANASSGGSVRYKGDPEKVYVNSSSGGSVKKY